MEIPWQARVSLFWLICAFIFMVVSHLSPFWYMEEPYTHIGLWEKCEWRKPCVWSHENHFYWEIIQPGECVINWMGGFPRWSFIWGWWYFTFLKGILSEESGSLLNVSMILCKNGSEELLLSTKPILYRKLQCPTSEMIVSRTLSPRDLNQCLQNMLNCSVEMCIFSPSILLLSWYIEQHKFWRVFINHFVSPVT